MNSISFHIYKTPQHNTWTLAYTSSGHKHTEVYPTKNDAIQASYKKATAATDLNLDPDQDPDQDPDLNLDLDPDPDQDPDLNLDLDPDQDQYPDPDPDLNLDRLS